MAIFVLVRTFCRAVFCRQSYGHRSMWLHSSIGHRSTDDHHERCCDAEFLSFSLLQWLHCPEFGVDFSGNSSKTLPPPNNSSHPFHFRSCNLPPLSTNYLRHYAAFPVSWEHSLCAHSRNRRDFRCSRWVLNCVEWRGDCGHWVCCFVRCCFQWHPQRCDAWPADNGIAARSMGFRTNQSWNTLHSFHKSAIHLRMTRYASVCELVSAHAREIKIKQKTTNDKINFQIFWYK